MIEGIIMHACVQFEVCLSTRITSKALHLKSTLSGHHTTGNADFQYELCQSQRMCGDTGVY